MATMNKPAYAAIQTHSPMKPVLIFVSSRRQTRLTALDVIAYAAADEKPRAFLRISDEEIDQMLPMVKDASLRHTLQFGVGLHHAGLAEDDRSLVERLFVGGKIQILVATSTLAWGVNTPAHLVIIKGTEFYDAPTKRYVDYPITDVLQMMGRAGRPQYDHHGVAVVMVHEPKKSFYKKFIYEPFPVESSLPAQIADHLNAEVAGGTIRSKQDAIDYLTWTFFLRRLLQNPSYYGLDSIEPEAVSAHLSQLIGDALGTLADAGCVLLDDDGGVEGTGAGRITSFYYLRHATMAGFTAALGPGMGEEGMLRVLCSAGEYDELPVRHNEDKLNAGMVGQVRFPPALHTVDDPHTKASLLIQAHLARLPLPISDYVTDTKSVLDNSLRILQAVVDVAADAGWADSACAAMRLVQSLVQARWYDDNPLLQLPHATPATLEKLRAAKLGTLAQLVAAHRRNASAAGVALEAAFGVREARDVRAVLDRIPSVELSTTVSSGISSSEDTPDEGGKSSSATATQKNDAQSFAVEVKLTRTHGRSNNRGGGAAPRVYAPRFPKLKEEGWWLIAVDPTSEELLAMKRVSFGQQARVKLAVPCVTVDGRKLEAIVVRLVCDSYLGLDQEHRISLVGGNS